jgi:hypothetical protein
MREKEPKMSRSQSQVEGNQPDYHQRYSKLVLHLVVVVGTDSIKLHRQVKSKRSLKVQGKREVGRHLIHQWMKEMRNWK